MRIRIFLTNGPDGCWRSKKSLDPMRYDRAPECTGVGSTNRLAFVEHCCCTHKKRGVDDITVANYPTDVRGSPEDISSTYSVYVRHRPGERNSVPAIVAYDAFG